VTDLEMGNEEGWLGSTCSSNPYNALALATLHSGDALNSTTWSGFVGVGGIVLIQGRDLCYTRSGSASGSVLILTITCCLAKINVGFELYRLIPTLSHPGFGLFSACF
jgi:hypothetical protein